MILQGEIFGSYCLVKEKTNKKYNPTTWYQVREDTQLHGKFNSPVVLVKAYSCG